MIPAIRKTSVQNVKKRKKDGSPGVLDALISVDSYQLGYQALQSVFEICQNGNTSSYVNTGFDFLKKSEDTQK